MGALNRDRMAVGAAHGASDRDEKRMKQGMTNVDVAAIAAELGPLLVGSRVEKVWQPAKEAILLRVRRKGAGKSEVLFELGRFLTVTARPPTNPDKPSMLAQTLRTQLENSRVTAFHQVGFDRLLRMDLERGDGKRTLVFELFGDGNLLLLDGDGVILLPMKGADHGARRLRKGEPYVAPPGASLPFGLDVAGLKAATTEAKDIVRGLAVNLGFGPLWGEELCLRCGVDKKTAPGALTDAQWAALHATIQQLGRDIERNDLAPALVYEAGKPSAGAPGGAAEPGDVKAGVPGDAKASVPGDANETVAAAPLAPDAAVASVAAVSAPAADLVDAVPFVMLRYPAPRFAHEQANTFREALDAFFVGAAPAEGEEELDDPRRPRYDEAKRKIQHQLDQVDAAITDFLAQEETARRDGDALYASFQQVQAVLDGLNAARGGRSWEQVEATLAAARAEGNAAAKQVVAVRPHEGKATLVLALPDEARREVDVDLRLSVQENAEECYAAAKKARSRREGAESALAQARGRLKDLEKKGLDGFGAAPERPQRLQRHFWFESYRWTVTPGGFLAVGGRNAMQNDAVVKKYLRDGDRYVHADAHGAPSVVLRPAEGASGDFAPEDLRAACQFAAAASRAWRQGGSASAYWVTPAQVSKTPNAGEFVPRGAWMVHGRRNIESNLPLIWGVAMVRFDSSGKPLRKGEPDAARTFTKLVGGDPTTLALFSDEVVRLVPGPMEANDAAGRLAEQFKVSLEEAQAVLPGGPVAFEGAA